MKKLFKKIMIVTLITCVSITALNISVIQAKEIKQQASVITPEEKEYFKGKLKEQPIIGDKKDITIEIGNNLYDVYNIDNLEKIYFVKVSDFTLFSTFRSMCFPGDYGYPYCKGNFPKPQSDPRANEQFIRCFLEKTFGSVPRDLSIATILAIFQKKGRDEALKYIATTAFGPFHYAVGIAIWNSAACIFFGN